MRFERWAMVVVLGLLCVGAGACQSVRTTDSVLPQLAGNETQRQLDFWHALARKPMISNDEAAHALLLYVDRADQAATYADRVAALKSRGLISRSFDEPADEALDRGTLAVAAVNILKLRNAGLTLAILGANERYATRELEFQGIYPPSSPNQVLSGVQFLGVMGKVTDRRQGHPEDFPAAVLPSQIRGKNAVSVDPTLVAERLLGDWKNLETRPLYAMIGAAQLTLDPLAAATAPATASASTPATAPGQRMGVITAVEGDASARENSQAAWKPATKGMRLTEAAEIQTGPDGVVQVVFPPGEVLRVDRLSAGKILQLRESGNSRTTDVGMEYGRESYDLGAGGLLYQSSLRSPNATLAVRGTQVSLTDDRLFPPQAVSLTGTAQFAGFRRAPVLFGAPAQGKTVVTTENQNPAALALAQSIIDPTLQGARTSSEAALLATLISRGATVTIDRNSGIPIVRNGGHPTVDATFVSTIPGQLSFVLTWETNSNLDLAVSTPDTAKTLGGEFIYPVKGLNIAPSGGKTAFDHQGGTGPTGGIEVVFLPTGTPTGQYSLAAVYAGGEKPTVATMQGFYNGLPVDILDFSTPALGTKLDQLVDQGSPAIWLASVGGPFPDALIESIFPPLLPASLVKRAAPLPQVRTSPAAVQGPVRVGPNLPVATLGAVQGPRRR